MADLGASECAVLSFGHESECATIFALDIHISKVDISSSRRCRGRSLSDSAPNCRGIIVGFSTSSGLVRSLLSRGSPCSLIVSFLASSGLVRSLFGRGTPRLFIISFAANLSLLRILPGACCSHSSRFALRRFSDCSGVSRARAARLAFAAEARKYLALSRQCYFYSSVRNRLLRGG